MPRTRVKTKAKSQAKKSPAEKPPEEEQRVPPPDANPGELFGTHMVNWAINRKRDIAGQEYYIRCRVSLGNLLANTDKNIRQMLMIQLGIPKADIMSTQEMNHDLLITACKLLHEFLLDEDFLKKSPSSVYDLARFYRSIIHDRVTEIELNEIADECGVADRSEPFMAAVMGVDATKVSKGTQNSKMRKNAVIVLLLEKLLGDAAGMINVAGCVRGWLLVEEKMQKEEKEAQKDNVMFEEEIWQVCKILHWDCSSIDIPAEAQYEELLDHFIRDAHGPKTEAESYNEDDDDDDDDEVLARELVEAMVFGLEKLRLADGAIRTKDVFKVLDNNMGKGHSKLHDKNDADKHSFIFTKYQYDKKHNKAPSDRRNDLDSESIIKDSPTKSWALNMVERDLMCIGVCRNQIMLAKEHGLAPQYLAERFDAAMDNQLSGSKVEGLNQFVDPEAQVEDMNVSDLIFEKIIGTGGFAAGLVASLLEDRRLRLCAKVEISRLFNALYLFRSVLAWSKLSHPTVARLLSIRYIPMWTVPPPRRGRKKGDKSYGDEDVCTVTLMELGCQSLMDEINAAAENQEAPKRSWEFMTDRVSTLMHAMYCVAAALAYIHARGMIHRDIKPENLIRDSLTGLIKVIDFNLMRPVASGNPKDKLTGRVGTEGYKAPEVRKNEEYTGKADVYSLGVSMFEYISIGVLINSTDFKKSKIIRYLEEEEDDLIDAIGNIIVSMTEKEQDSRADSFEVWKVCRDIIRSRPKRFEHLQDLPFLHDDLPWTALDTEIVTEKCRMCGDSNHQTVECEDFKEREAQDGPEGQLMNWFASLANRNALDPKETFQSFLKNRIEVMTGVLKTFPNQEGGKGSD